MRTVRSRVVLLAAGLLAACHDRPPREYQPADSGCAPLQGDWVVSDADLQRLGLDDGRPEVFPFLSIEIDINGHPTLVLRPRIADLRAQAEVMRLTRPDEYRAWRADVLGEPAPSQLANLVWTGPRPVAEIRRPFSPARCEDGWFRDALDVDVVPRPGSEPVPHTAYVSFALGGEGELLIERHVRRQTFLDGSFFGQPIRWYRYAYSDWARIPPVPPGFVHEALGPGDLPPMPGRIERQELAIALREDTRDFERWVRDHLPAGNELLRLRALPADPAAPLRPDQVRYELAGLHRAGIAEPFTPVLRRHAYVGAIRRVADAPGADGRRYVRLEFVLTVTPDALFP